ncbi:MAG: cytochrome c [Pseudomonadota bacterium]
MRRVAALALLAASAANADEGARLALGKKLFTAAVPPCALCHTLKDAGTSGTIGPPLDELQPDAEQVTAALRQGVGVMPSYREKLSEEEIQALARYVSRATRGAK